DAKISPCDLHSRDSGRLRAAVTGGGSSSPGSLKAVGERRAPPVVPSNPNSRQGRKERSPIRQGRVAMESIIVGIDVSKDRLDVAMRPSGAAFVVARDARGLDELIARWREVSPHIVA